MFAPADVPHAEPVCPKEPYYKFAVTSSGANQSFLVPTLADYPMACDSLLSHNGAMALPDYEYALNLANNNIIFFSYLQAGDLLDLLPTPSPESIIRTREFYLTMPRSGAGQIISHPWLVDYDTINEFNCTLNGISLVENVDFTWDGTSITLVIYVNQDDWFGVLPSVSLRYTKTVTGLTFPVTFTSAGQMFNNPALAAYTKAEDIILTVDGVCLQPTTDYTFIGSSLTVSAYLQSGSYLTVFANASSCS